MPTISVTTRHWKNINIQDLCYDIESQLENVNLEDGELDYCVNLFESTVRNILDDHAPLKTRTVKLQSESPGSIIIIIIKICSAHISTLLGAQGAETEKNMNTNNLQ